MSKSHNNSPAIEKAERWMDGWMDENNEKIPPPKVPDEKIRGIKSHFHVEKS
jgi:hypothetical protein